MMIEAWQGKISVVIPMYNSRETIVSTLDSVLKQTAFESILEIIIVNDGSTDNSPDIVKKYADVHIGAPIVMIDKPNGGVSSARNMGMKAAKGEWIALLDSDDQWLPDKIEIQVKAIQQHPEIDFLGGDTDDKGLNILWRHIDSLYKATVKDICLKTFPQTSAALFRKGIFEDIGGYDENQSFAEDVNYFLKICTRYQYYHLPVNMVFYGGGKPGFGFSGLSANMKKMYEGNVKNIRELKALAIISDKFYLFLRVFYWAKYIRRILIVKLFRNPKTVKNGMI